MHSQFPSSHNIRGTGPPPGIDLDFTIQKVQWSTYDISHPAVKGTLRLLAIPIKILELPTELAPPNCASPFLGPLFHHMVAFKNVGKKGTPDPRPATFQEYAKSPKEDITNFTKPLDEPYNEFAVTRDPPYLIRTRTILMKIELLKDRWNQFGDPVLWPQHQTSQSVSECKTAGPIAAATETGVSVKIRTPVAYG